MSMSLGDVFHGTRGERERWSTATGGRRGGEEEREEILGEGWKCRRRLPVIKWSEK